MKTINASTQMMLPPPAPSDPINRVRPPCVPEIIQRARRDQISLSHLYIPTQKKAPPVINGPLKDAQSIAEAWKNVSVSPTMAKYPSVENLISRQAAGLPVKLTREKLLSAKNMIDTLRTEDILATSVRSKSNATNEPILLQPHRSQLPQNLLQESSRHFDSKGNLNARLRLTPANNKYNALLVHDHTLLALSLLTTCTAIKLQMST